MNRLTLHLVRGAIAALLILWALLLQEIQPMLAVIAVVLAFVAMRGCPACWILGLCDTIGEL